MSSLPSCARGGARLAYNLHARVVAWFGDLQSAIGLIDGLGRQARWEGVSPGFLCTPFTPPSHHIHTPVPEIHTPVPEIYGAVTDTLGTGISLERGP